MLQFWIAADDSLGLNFKDETIQDYFRVLYYPEIQKENLVSDFSFLPQGEYLPFLSNSEYELSFAKKDMPINILDYRSDKLFDSEDMTEEFFCNYENMYSYYGHRIGGYPNFRQSDPRGFNDDDSEYKGILLLQIDSDEENNIQWGYGGLANFFIDKKDLENRNFSNVLYNWESC